MVSNAKLLAICVLTKRSFPGFSHSICNDCKTKAVDAFAFRQTCISSDEIIRTPNEVEPVEMFIKEQVEFEQDLSMDGANGAEELVECHFCSEAFQSTSELALHVGICHEEPGNAENVEQEIVVAEEMHTEISAAAAPRLTRQIRTTDERKYECTICGKKFQTPSKARRHLVVHRDVLDPSDFQPRRAAEYKYKCDTCGKKVETPSKLERHMRSHNRYANRLPAVNEQRPHGCEQCEERFWDVIKLERHRIVHTELFMASKIQHEEDHVFTCVYCLQTTSEYEDMIKHMKQHREAIGDSTGVRCELCKKIYPKMTGLIRHARSHVENATHQCCCCDKKMGMGDDLIDHFLRHDGFKPYACDYPYCGKSFVKMFKLRNHKQVHDRIVEKPFNCDKCDKSFANQEYLRRHLIRHTGEKPFICHLCPTSFAFRSGLNAHLLTHSDKKPFKCSICDARFNKRAALMAHFKIHTQDVSEKMRGSFCIKNYFFLSYLQKKFACEVCGMRFITSGHLRRHELTHTGMKPFQCQYCEKAYAQSNDLSKHLRSHLGPNIYKCEVEGCNDSFSKFGELKRHKQEHFITSDMIVVDEAYEVVYE